MFSTATQNRKKESWEISPVKCMFSLYLPALRLYRKSGFRGKKEKRRYFILGKDLENVSGV